MEVAVEQLLQAGNFEADWWKLQYQRVLSGRTLERAMVTEQKGGRAAIHLPPTCWNA